MLTKKDSRDIGREDCGKHKPRTADVVDRRSTIILDSIRTMITLTSCKRNILHEMYS